LDNLVYEDDPWAYLSLPYREMLRVYVTRTAWTRVLPWSMHLMPAILTIFIAGLLLAFILSFTQSFQIAIFWVIVGPTLFLMDIVAFTLYPTKYQVFHDKIRIVISWLFHFDIPFNNIDNFSAATWNDTWGLNFGFINSFSSDDILRITRKRGAKIYITPWDRKLFLEHLNRAMQDWRRNSLR